MFLNLDSDVQSLRSFLRNSSPVASRKESIILSTNRLWLLLGNFFTLLSSKYQIILPPSNAMYQTRKYNFVSWSVSVPCPRKHRPEKTLYLDIFCTVSLKTEKQLYFRNHGSTKSNLIPEIRVDFEHRIFQKYTRKKKHNLVLSSAVIAS